jgi:hypothetical protein
VTKKYLKMHERRRDRFLRRSRSFAHVVYRTQILCVRSALTPRERILSGFVLHVTVLAARRSAEDNSRRTEDDQVIVRECCS